MKRYLTRLITKSLLVIVTSFLIATVQAQSSHDLRQLVQMPIATAKAAEASASKGEIERIAEALNRGRVAPVDFNQIMRSAVHARRAGGDVTSIGEYTESRVEEGLRGRALAESIHAKLRSLGIPAGGWRGEGPPPVAREFIPPFARGRIDRRERDDIDRGPPPEIRRSLPAPAREALERRDRRDEHDRVNDELERKRERREEELERERERKRERPGPPSGRQGARSGSPGGRP
ncbi:MAG: hypothetical protein ACRD1R_18570 [Acidobacteriota bacterium]